MIEQARLTVTSSNLFFSVLNNRLRKNKAALVYDMAKDKLLLEVELPNGEIVYDEFGCMDAILNMQKASRSDIKCMDRALLRLLNRRDLGYYTDEPKKFKVFKDTGSNIEVTLEDLFKYVEVQ